MGEDTAIIRFDADGNLDLFGLDGALSEVFCSSDSVLALRSTLSDFDTFAKCCPDMVAIVGELLPKNPEYAADLSTATLKLMREGRLFLRPDKEGRLLATLVDAETNRIDQIVRLKEIQPTLAVSNIAFSLSFMAITQQLKDIQESIAELREAQIHDREDGEELAAMNLRWAAAEGDSAKRERYCLLAHKYAWEGLIACRNTVKESVAFFMAQPSNPSPSAAIAEQIKPWNWRKTFSALKGGASKASELRRSVAMCTCCAQYASASSFMLGDSVQVVRDLEEYASLMSEELLGERAEHLRPWFSPKTLRAIPLFDKALPSSYLDGPDVLSCVEATVSRIKDFRIVDELPPEVATRSLDTAATLPKE